MGRRSEHSREEIREMALEAAERLVERDGMSGLSTRKVADAIGYSVGSLYMVFENLDDLIVQLNGRTLDDLTADISAQLQQQPTKPLQALAKRYLKFAHRNRNRWQMAFEHRLPDGQAEPEWLKPKIDQMFALLTQTVANELPQLSQPDTEQAATAMWSGIHGICVLELNNKLAISGIASVTAMSEFLITTLITGLSPQR